MMVSDFTMTRTSLQRDRRRQSAVQNRRVQEVQSWPRPFAFEDGYLLPKSEDFDGRAASTAEENRSDGQKLSRSPKRNCRSSMPSRPILVTPVISV